MAKIDNLETISQKKSKFLDLISANQDHNLLKKISVKTKKRPASIQTKGFFY